MYTQSVLSPITSLFLLLLVFWTTLLKAERVYPTWIYWPAGALSAFVGAPESRYQNFGAAPDTYWCNFKYILVHLQIHIGSTSNTYWCICKYILVQLQLHIGAAPDTYWLTCQFYVESRPWIFKLVINIPIALERNLLRPTVGQERFRFNIFKGEKGRGWEIFS